MRVSILQYSLILDIKSRDFKVLQSGLYLVSNQMFTDNHTNTASKETSLVTRKFENNFWESYIYLQTNRFFTEYYIHHYLLLISHSISF